MIDSISKAIGDLFAPTSFRILLFSVIASALAFAVVAYVTISVVGTPGPLFETDWLNEALDWVTGFGYGLAILLATWFLFPPVANVLAGIFLDDVAEVVEKRHYPNHKPGVAQPIGRSVMLALKLGGVVLLVNLVALPFYLIFLFIPPLSLLLFYVLNGFLFSREYFELVSMRHVSEQQSIALRKKHRGRLVLAGMAITFVFSIPFVNLLAPMFGTAFMLHEYKRLPA